MSDSSIVYNLRVNTPSEQQTTTHDDSVGLCRTCARQRIIESAKGSTFYLCTLSERDTRFPKYPRLPVLHCAGYEPPSEQ